MIYLPGLNLCFVHCPKTGGTYVREVLKVFFPEYQEVSPKHGDIDAALIHWPKAECFTVLRHPADWLQSYWCDRMTKGWGGDLVIGHDCFSERFDTFACNVIERHPGYVSELFRRYVQDRCNVILWPNLFAGLLGVLDYRIAKQSMWLAIRAAEVEPVNQSSRDLKLQSQWNIETYHRFCEAEADAIETYGL